MNNGNTGKCNTGHYNIGNRNTGDRNAGNRNTGNRNIGHFNTGRYNTGYCNTGDYNKGYYNTGDYNASSHNSGFFNTQVHTVIIFDKPSDMTHEDWYDSKAYKILGNIDLRPLEWVEKNEMTDEEKEAHPEYETTGGYLKQRDMAVYPQQQWDKLPDEQKEIIKQIPNFDADKFKICTGIDVNKNA